MRSIRIATPLLVLGLALSACEQQGAETGEMEEAPADTVASVSDEEQLETLRDEYVAAWEARDIDALVAIMTPTYHEISPQGSFDRAAAEAMVRDTTNIPPEGATLAIDMQTIEVAESGDVAYASGQSTMTVPAGDGGEGMSETMNWVAGFKKVDGAWKIDRLAMAPIAAESAEGVDTGTM